MKTDNELIAEFIGATLDRATSGGKRLWTLINLPEFCKQINIPESRIRVFYSDDLEFQTSWDWLMPAISKFFSLDFENDDLKAEYENLCVAISEKLLEIDISGAHERLVEGIKWYNTKKV